ncbi:MAG: methylated-DNA--[protein]-cysteine S-methyltransferase [Xanthobacteraceae bacterium]|nr:methylated-DNA--[protein]-cysteine S-methyltransferase [Xanthobacteraceae bacterium]MCW5679644.1 methylated-DNA--[protein]-cysteine S-methyltransferase [Xanthobacteraceae bacterium]
MSAQQFAIFDTALGHCGIVWTNRGIAGVNLPEGSEEKTRARVKKRFPEAEEAAASPEIQKIIDEVIALVAGEKIDFSHVTLDHAPLPEFSKRVYEIVCTIPIGHTLTYGDIAKKLGDVSLSREVGQAMGKNPTPIIMPCHRVVAASGKTGGFSAPGGVDTKMKLLSIERRHGDHPPTLFDDDEAFRFAAKKG